MKAFKLRFLFAALFSIFFWTFASANEVEIHIVRSDGTFPPAEIMVSQDVVTGVHIDIINAIAKKLNWKVKIESLPWKRCLNLMEKGEADAISHIQKSDEREKFLWYENNILSENSFYFVVRKEDEEKFKFRGDIKSYAKAHKTIGVISGYFYPPIISQAGFHYENSRSDSALIEKLLGKRVDIIVAEKGALLYAAKINHVTDKLSFIEPEIVRFKLYLAFSKKTNGTKQQQEEAERNAKLFSTELEKFKLTNEYKAILAKYKD